MNRNDGVTIIEIIVTIAIIAVLIPASVAVFAAFYKAIPAQYERLQALTYLKEEEEQLRTIYQNSWTNVSYPSTTLSVPATNTYTYYHTTTGSNPDGSSTWALTSGTELLGTTSNFTRSIYFNHVYRNILTGNIVPTSGTGILDDSYTQDGAHTTQAVITVSWTKPYVSSVSSTIYLTQYLGNNNLTQIGPDFAAGTGGACVDLSASNIKIVNSVYCLNSSSAAERTYTSPSLNINSGSNVTVNNITWTTNAVDMDSTTNYFKFQLYDDVTLTTPFGPDTTQNTYFQFNGGGSGFSLIPIGWRYTANITYSVLLDPTSNGTAITGVNFNYTP